MWAVAGYELWVGCRSRADQENLGEQQWSSREPREGAIGYSSGNLRGDRYFVRVRACNSDSALAIAAHVMPKDLIIVESPAKVRTIKKFLGPGYTVDASVGHVRDLPKATIGVDEENGFAPRYEVIPGKSKVVSRLKKEAAAAGTVFLAPDPDREGEAIAWHVAELIKGANPNLRRIEFNQITRTAVQDALARPRELNMELINSQQARRILDRLVGYKISPLLWKKVRRGLSAGRVQSVALRLIVERERERQAFEPQEYWVLTAKLSTEAGETFTAELWKEGGKVAKVGSRAEAETILARVRKAGFSVEATLEKEKKQRPSPPFTTSTMQQAANRTLNLSAKRTMSLAQNLYEGVDLGELGTTALVTYIRTDSVRVAGEAVQAAREYIGETFGTSFLPAKPKVYASKGKTQDAHEAIRPIDVRLTPERVEPHLNSGQFRLYRLIWQRFTASQMEDARFMETEIHSRSDNTLWKTSGRRLLFPGFLSAYGKSEEEETSLPEVKPKEPLRTKKISSEQKFTQPPARYTEATLVKKLEEAGIGRPSTYAAIIETLVGRDYVALEKKQFLPTELGYVVCDLLVAHFARLMDVGFTSEMEASLDQVAEGEEDWVALLNRFNSELAETLDTADKRMKMVKTGMVTEIACPECGKPMAIKFGKNGPFLACTAYPDCKGTANFTRDEQGAVQIARLEPAELEKKGECPECGQDLVVKKSRTGSRFIACTGYPKCRYTHSFSTGVPCPREGCGGTLVEKSSRRGKLFYSCDRYPSCDYAVWDEPVARACPECGFPHLVRKVTRQGADRLVCPQKECRFSMKAEAASEAE